MNRVRYRWLRAQDLNLGAQVVWRQTAVPLLGLRFAVTCLGFPDRPQIFPALATRDSGIGRQERWRKRIQGLANELRLQITELEDQDKARAATTRRTLEDLEASRRFCAF